MKEIRCKNCKRFLCKLAFGQLEIKCPNSKCKAVNKVKLTTYKQLLTAVPEQSILKA